MTIRSGDFVRAINPKLDLPPGSVWVADGEGWAGAIGVSLEPFNRTAKDTIASYWHGKRFFPCDFEKVKPVRDGWVSVEGAEFIEHADEDAPKTASAGAQAAFEEQIAIRQSEIKSLRRAAKERAEKDAALAAELAIIKAEQERVQRRNALLYADQELARATTALLAEIHRLNNGGINQPATAVISLRAAELQPLAKRHGYKLAAAGTLHVLTAL